MRLGGTMCMLKEITEKNRIDYSNIPTNSIDENLKNIVSIMKIFFRTFKTNLVAEQV
jgi:hypothetical protein